MTFTFDPTLATDLSTVRFHIGDTNEAGHFLEDETITSLLTSTDLAHAVISCIRYIITQLSQPDFKLDWMSVSNMKDARVGFEGLLKTKAQEFGISATGAVAVSSISSAHRADSYENESGVYTAPDGSPLEDLNETS